MSSMKRRILVGKILIAFGLLILVGLAVAHFHAAAHHQLHPFDEDGEPVFVPFIGTISLGVGLFLLALSGSSKKS